MKAFVNGTVITDSGVIPDGMVLVQGDRIDYVGTLREVPAGADVIDARGLYVSPGFVDIHIHGGAGSDFMDASAIDIEMMNHQKISTS